MRKNLQEKILNKYPKIFAQFTLPPSQTCMCWGLECGDGWYALIDALCMDIQTYIDANGIPQIEATQVKQKFGELRFYYGPYEKELDRIIWQACQHSVETCELCGETDNVVQTKKGWILPLCEKCMEKQKKLK